MRPLTHDELGRLLRAESGRGQAAGRNRALIRVFADAGLGVGEALALGPGDLDPPAGRVRVPGTRARTVDVSAEAMDDLVAWSEQRRALGLVGAERLFCTSEGLPLDASYVRRMLGRLGRRAGLGVPVNARTLRESFATARIAAGCSADELREALGHATLASTQRYVNRIAPARAPAPAARPDDPTEALLASAHCGLAVVAAVRTPVGDIVDYTLEYVNPAAAGILRSMPERLVGRSVLERFPSAAHDGTFDRWTTLIAEQGRGGDDERRYEEGEGVTQWFGVRRAACGDRVVLSFEDLGALKQAEEEAALLASRKAALMGAAREGLVIIGADGRIAAANRAAGRILGLAADRIVGRTPFDPRWDAIRPDGSECPADEHPSVITMTTGRALADQRVGIRHPEGRVLWLSVSTEPLVGGGGPPYAVAVAFHDLADLREARAAASCARSAAALAAECGEALLLRCAPDGMILDASGASSELVGCEPHELLGHRCEERVHPDDAGALRRAYLDAMRGREAVRLDHRVLHLSGRIIQVTRILRAARDESDDEVLEVQSILRTAGETMATRSRPARVGAGLASR